MILLFLDIDGVLNNPKTKERCLGYLGVDRTLSKKLVSWLSRNQDVSVILSSTWRNHPEMHFHLKEAGLSWIGQTPWLNVGRGTEIKVFLDKFLNLDKVENYIVLDDDNNMWKKQLPHFVRVNPITGLTDANISQMDDILLGGGDDVG